MHCPKCGNESALTQHFCRKCGFDLTPVGELIAERPREIRMDKAERERRMIKHMIRWMTRGFIVLALGVIMLVTNKTFDLGKLFALLSSILMLVGMALAVYGVISAVTLTVTLSENQPGDADERELKEADTTKELPAGLTSIPVPSVTERTTQLIERDPQGNK